MKKYIPVIIILLAAAIVGAAAYAWQMQSEETSTSSINSFRGCEQAGYPIMESYPRQCRTPDGRTFVEDIPEPIERPDGGAICIDTCGDGACAEIVCLGSGCPCAETPSSCPADCNSRAE